MSVLTASIGHDLLFALGLVLSCAVVSGLLAGIAYRFWVWLGPDRSGGLTADDPVLSGHCAQTVIVRASVSPCQALDIVCRAIQQIGTSTPERWDPKTIVGWYNQWGLSFTQVQLAVVLQAAPDGCTEFLCCGRPRWSRTRYDFGLSRNRVQRLSRAIEQMAEAAVAEGHGEPSGECA